VKNIFWQPNILEILWKSAAKILSCSSAPPSPDARRATVCSQLYFSQRSISLMLRSIVIATSSRHQHSTHPDELSYWHLLVKSILSTDNKNNIQNHEISTNRRGWDLRPIDFLCAAVPLPLFQQYVFHSRSKYML
jgi:hypothetical protein